MKVADKNKNSKWFLKDIADDAVDLEEVDFNSRYILRIVLIIQICAEVLIFGCQSVKIIY